MLFRHLILSLLFVSIIGELFFSYCCYFFTRPASFVNSIVSRKIVSSRSSHRFCCRLWVILVYGYFLPFYVRICVWGCFLHVLLHSILLMLFIASMKRYCWTKLWKSFVRISEMWTNWYFIFVMKCEQCYISIAKFGCLNNNNNYGDSDKEQKRAPSAQRIVVLECICQKF